MLIFYRCSLSSKHQFIFYAYSRRWILVWVMFFHQLQNCCDGFHIFIFCSIFCFLFWKVGFELFLIITNWLNTLSVGWFSLKRGFPQQPFPFPHIDCHKESKLSEENSSYSSRTVPSSPNLTCLSQVDPSPCYISTNCSRHKNTLSRGHLDYKWAHMTFP